jgi:hypothetical protein
MDSETVQLLQEIINRGEIDSLPEDIKPMVMELASRGVLSVPQQAAPQPAAIPQRSIGGALMEGVQNFPQSMARLGTGFMDAVTNPEQTLPAMLDMAAGGMNKLGGVLGLDQMGQSPDGPMIPGAAPEQTQAFDALMQNYADAYGGGQNILNTLATDPARPLADALSLATPEMLAGAVKLPGVIARNTPRVKTLPEYLYSHALAAGGGNVKDTLVKQATRTALDRDIPITRAGVKEIKNQMRKEGAEIGRIIKEADSAGVTIDPLEFVTEIRAAGAEQVTPLTYGGTKAANPYNKLADDFMDFVANTYGTNGAVPNQIPVKAFHEFRKKTGKDLQGYWNALNKNPTPSTSRQARATVEGYRTAGKQLTDAVPELVPANKAYHESAVLSNLLENITNKQFKEQFVPSQITLPLAVEVAARGKPGVATVIGAGRVFSRRIEQFLARHLHNRMQNKPIVKDKGKRAAAREGVRVYSGGSQMEALLEEEMNGR